MLKLAAHQADYGILSMASRANLTIENRNGSRTGLVSSITGSGRSYGTVKSLSPSAARRQPGTGYSTHIVVEGDTLPGLALKYGVTVSFLTHI